MEFIIVTFPTRRAVRMDGLPFGRTGTKKRLEAGHHRFDLGPDEDYTPPFDERNVIGTTFETPLVIPFRPLPTAVIAEAVIPPAKPRAAGRKRAAGERATAKRSRKRVTPTAKTARATKRKKGAGKTSSGHRTKK